jgi:peptidoglycan/xylan/chitin deacetylase (PgdA/CDA1 family)
MGPAQDLSARFDGSFKGAFGKSIGWYRSVARLLFWIARIPHVRMPEGCVRGKVGRRVTEQYVLISFDGSDELESWQAWRAFAEKHPSLRMTFFVSGSSFLSEENRALYQGPRSAPGDGGLPFGGTRAELLERVAYMNALYQAGHEIASHAVGHIDGASWTPAEWLEEFDAFDRLLENFAANNDASPQESPLFGPRDIKGFRAPFLSVGPGLDAALAARAFRYDASMTGLAGDWPTKNGDGVWKYKLANIPLRGFRAAPLAMDYNFFVVQTREEPGIFAEPARVENGVVEAYQDYFERNYLSNRAPIHIGHHFTDYHGTVYRDALMRFIESVIDRPDVRFCTYAQLSDHLDRAGSPPIATGGGRVSGKPQVRGWQAGTVAALVRTALLPRDAARSAWQEWKAARNFDDITWDEMRLLVPVAARLEELDPTSPLRPRIDGLAKHLWTRTQMNLRESCQALDCLNAAGVPFLVFKGGAQYAEGLAVSPRRVMGDVDILIRQERLAPALDALEADGWLAVGGESFAYLRQALPTRLRANFRKGRYGEIDLHVSPFHFARSTPALEDALWSRSRPADLALRPVLVPDPTDSVLLILAHGAEGNGGDWALDIATRVQRQTIDWDRLVETAEQRGLAAPCRDGLAFLAHAAGVAVPERVLVRLAASRIPLAERLKNWSNARHPQERNRIEKLADRLADSLLRRRGYEVFIPDAQLRRAVRAPRAWLNRNRGQDVPPSGLGLEHGRVLSGGRSAGALFVRMSLDPPAHSRRFLFELAVDGVVMARLRMRAGGKEAGTVERLFRVPLSHRTGGALSVTVTARPLQLPSRKSTAADIARIGVVPFRLVGMWTA